MDGETGAGTPVAPQLPAPPGGPPARPGRGRAVAALLCGLAALVAAALGQIVPARAAAIALGAAALALGLGALIQVRLQRRAVPGGRLALSGLACGAVALLAAGAWTLAAPGGGPDGAAPVGMRPNRASEQPAGAVPGHPGRAPDRPRSSPSDRPGTPTTPTSGSATPVERLQPGQCFTASSADVEAYGPVDVVSCTRPHAYEVFAVVDHPAGTDDSFPGQAEVGDWADGRCVDEFVVYVGTAYASSRYYITTVEPTRDSWQQGERAIVCVLYVPVPDESLTGTARGSSR